MIKTPFFQDKKDITEITDALIDLSLPKEKWTHTAHLIAAYDLLHRYSKSELEHILPTIIRRYNEATNTPNTAHDGYHETITLFYIRAIANFIDNLPPGTRFLEGCNRLFESPVSKDYFPLDYYSKDCLFSLKARQTWVMPDIKQAPFL